MYAFVHIKPSLLGSLKHKRLPQTLEKTSDVEFLNSINYSKRKETFNLTFCIRILECFLDEEWVKYFPKDKARQEEAEIFWEEGSQVYFWMVSQMDHKIKDKFLDKTGGNHNTDGLWEDIHQHYASSSVENCANVIMKIFNLKMEERNAL
ncbi:hypothetical protein O181_070599 [Austropuccinia psidii MF-1]|uniref:Uncharacterized protein n=1 Tax=Austropuccinia psidii MF-1 TaxID=1389203 RepID=A0A9Q3F1J8_9BASI|nr:hypothetical protein [Austropuccinia psidii MF-1]